MKYKIKESGLTGPLKKKLCGLLSGEMGQGRMNVLLGTTACTYILNREWWLYDHLLQLINEV